MAKTKLFSNIEIEEAARVFKMLSETSRLKIIKVLNEKESCVQTISEKTGLQQANVSKQLKILESAHIIKCRPEGLQRFYRISDKSVIQICKMICKSRKD